MATPRFNELQNLITGVPTVLTPEMRQQLDVIVAGNSPIRPIQAVSPAGSGQRIQVNTADLGKIVAGGATPGVGDAIQASRGVLPNATSRAINGVQGAPPNLTTAGINPAAAVAAPQELAVVTRPKSRLERIGDTLARPDVQQFLGNVAIAMGAGDPNSVGAALGRFGAQNAQNRADAMMLEALVAGKSIDEIPESILRATTPEGRAAAMEEVRRRGADARDEQRVKNETRSTDQSIRESGSRMEVERRRVAREEAQQRLDQSRFFNIELPSMREALEQGDFNRALATQQLELDKERVAIQQRQVEIQGLVAETERLVATAQAENLRAQAGEAGARADALRNAVTPERITQLTTASASITTEIDALQTRLQSAMRLRDRTEDPSTKATYDLVIEDMQSSVNTLRANQQRIQNSIFSITSQLEGSGTGPNPGSSRSNPVDVRNEADIQRLRSGQYYRTPSGNVVRKN